LFQFQEAWDGIRSQVEYAAQEKAIMYWKQQWSHEPANVPPKNPEYLTDAQRSNMRAAPRQPSRCKCNSQEHQYVNDIHCPLYSNLRSLLDDKDDAATSTLHETEVLKRNRTLTKSLPRDLNVVENAFKDRFVRMKVEKEAEEAEARFVSRMEEIQLTKCNQAIFAPSLTAMVLSAVVELEPKFEGKALSPLMSVPLKPEPVAQAKHEEDSDNDDDDDDVPLAALGKRPNDDSDPDQANKRQRGDMPVRHQFLAKLVQFISTKWGHVFREASNEEYTW
jgi:hypothetical protein